MGEQKIKDKYYFIENDTIGYKEMGKYQYPIHALHWFKAWLKPKSEKFQNLQYNQAYYLRDEDDNIIAKGRCCHKPIITNLSPGLTGLPMGDLDI